MRVHWSPFVVKKCEKEGSIPRILRGRSSVGETRGLPLRTATATLCGVKQSDWKTISSERHFANAHLEVVTNLVQTPARRDPRSWTIAHRKAAVIIAPMTRDGKIVLIRQERIPIRAAIWEMPSGQIDNGLTGDAGPAHCTSKAIEEVALRELREEVGYELTQDGKLIAFGH